MEGSVKNISSEWSYVMKRSVRPGGEIPLDELYEQYGKKYELSPGEEFIEWLSNVKLRNKNRWKIVYDFKGDGASKSGKDSSTEVKTKNKSSDSVSPMVSNKMQVEDIVNLTVRKARDVLKGINDVKLLIYSLAEARQLSGKDSLCREIDKRIKQLYISRQ
jgi:hypothetical protein